MGQKQIHNWMSLYPCQPLTRMTPCCTMHNTTIYVSQTPRRSIISRNQSTTRYCTIRDLERVHVKVDRVPTRGMSAKDTATRLSSNWQMTGLKMYVSIYTCINCLLLEGSSRKAHCPSEHPQLRSWASHQRQHICVTLGILEYMDLRMFALYSAPRSHRRVAP